MEYFLGCFNTKFTFKYRPLIRNISFFKNKTKKDDPYVIVRPTCDEYCDVLQLMWNSYHPYEPTTKSLNLGHKHNPVFDESAIKTLTQGYSYVAKCKYTGCIVGGSLNEITNEWDPDQMDKLACTLSCKDSQKLFHFWAYLQRAPNVYEKYCVDKVFEISQVFVSPDERGQGLAYRLMKKSQILGADAGFGLIRVDATNVFTAKICEKLKMQLIHVIPYCSYIGENNEQVFRPEPPNIEVRTYIDLPHAMKRK